MPLSKRDFIYATEPDIIQILKTSEFSAKYLEVTKQNFRIHQGGAKKLAGPIYDRVSAIHNGNQPNISNLDAVYDFIQIRMVDVIGHHFPNNVNEND